MPSLWCSTSAAPSIPAHVAELLHGDENAVIDELGDAIFRDPENGSWLTADAYLSGAVRSKLAAARAAAELDPSFARNVAALERVQPPDLRPSDITARLGAPWIPAADIIAFVKETMDADITIHHTAELACWTVNARQLSWTAAGTTEWGTHRRHAGELLSDALNSSIPQIFDTMKEGDSERRILNTVETEAAKEKLAKIKTAFQSWIWSDPDRTDRLARLYNDTFNNIVPRHFDGSHLQLPGASGAFSLYGHQKRAIWRIIASGSDLRRPRRRRRQDALDRGRDHGAAPARPDQQGDARRAGPLPGAGRARISGALSERPHPRRRRDEFREGEAPSFPVAGRDRELGRDRHHAFRLQVHSGAVRLRAADAAGRAEAYEDLLTRIDLQDRLSRKRLERMKEGHKERLEVLASRKDDLLTISEIGIDQIIVDEAQEFRKLSFATNMTSLRGVDPNGSQRAWDLYVKSRYVDMKNPGRALVLASGTPITNTLGEMFTVQRLMDHAALRERGLHEFDAWASTFGDTSTELELQPSGKYRPVTRFAQFVNVPELIAMFRSFADVVLPEDLRDFVKVPSVAGGKRQIITAEPTRGLQGLSAPARRAHHRDRGTRPRAGARRRYTALRHHRRPARRDRPAPRRSGAGQRSSTTNSMPSSRNAFRVWQETGGHTYRRKDGRPSRSPARASSIFSDLGTISVEASRGFSAYRWIRNELVRLGVPGSEIAYMQEFKKSEAKQRLFNDFNAGKVRFIIGSSDTMGTGVNVQLRLKALHHLDVPWLPSQIEQREGRIVRQGNQHDEVDIFAYATLGSLDATMWQNNERKARFIAAALSGDISVRRLEDLGEGQANQFAMAKAIASGDPRLMQKAGLEAEIARLERLRAAHIDDQHAIRRQLRDAEREIERATRRISEIGQDIERFVPTAGEAFAMTIMGTAFAERKPAGRALMQEVLALLHLQHEKETVIASIGGFDLVFVGQRLGRDGYHYTTLLRRTGAEFEIELPVTVTPLGAIARLEHAV